jgi:hypothetical protein
MKMAGRKRKRSEYPGICLQKAEENQGEKTQNNRLRGRGFNAAPAKCEAGTQTKYMQLLFCVSL